MKMPTHLAPFDNGAYCARKLGFLYFIRRTSFVDPVRSLMNTLGGDPPMWSRVFKWTSEFVADKLGWKLEARGLSFFQPWFEMYSEAIRNKANEKGREIRGGGATDLFPNPGDMVRHARRQLHRDLHPRNRANRGRPERSAPPKR